MRITRTSPFSGDINEMEIPITQKQLDDYLNGELPIQVAFPQLSPSQREFILTGITPEEWDAAFKED